MDTIQFTTEKKNKLKGVLLVVLNILLVFSPEFLFLPKYTWLLAGIGVYVFVFNSRSSAYGVRGLPSFFLLALIAVNICLSIAVVVINGSGDYSYIVFLIGTLLSVFRVFLLIGIISGIRDDRSKLDVYCDSFLNACTVYVLFTLLFIAFPGFKEFWITKVVSTVTQDYAAYEFRYSLNGFAAFASSTIFSFSILLSAFLVVRNLNNSNKAKYFIYYFIMIVGGFFYGRISIVAIALSALYILSFVFYRIEIIKITCVVVLVLAIGIVALSILSKNNQSFAYWRDWAFAIVDQLFSGKGVTDYSVTHMFEDMYFSPPLKTILIGDGFYTAEDGSYYGHTDVGFLRPLLFFGLIGTLINYLMPLYILFKTKSIMKTRHDRLFIWFTIVLLFVLELKGEAYHRILLLVLPIYYTALYDSYEYNKTDIVAILSAYFFK